MEKLLVLFAILLCISCSDSTQTANKNIPIVESYISAVENLDYNTMESLLDESYQGFGPSFTDYTTKAEAVESWKYNCEYLYENIKYTRNQIAAVRIPEGPNKGDWIANWSELRITYKSGDEATIWANTNYKIENGKIVQTYTFYNEADVYRQLGYGYVKTDVD
ncbi:nuclear transport factor 2 family protein [Carboxylicivirga sp. RSCT41]|uniref:nuclear transport factor 2 family protein n=1 Tax=Carboxylicivirga agarovorans TaxID=3417570 RepID=UPI003D3261CD